MNLKTYKENQLKLTNSLKELLTLAQKENANSCADGIKTSLNLMKQDDFKVLVVGEFSRGKSTFVNALLGTNILPASVTPTTAIITKILYDSKPHVTIYKHQPKNSIEKISVDEFSNLRAPKNNDAEAQTKLNKLMNIDRAELFYPIDICKKGVELIDSPGVNDTETDRIEITYNYLKHADAAIILLAANQALTETELNFIKSKLNDEKIMDIFLVINFKDALSGKDEEDRVIQYVKDNLHENIPILNLKNNIFLVSSKQALIYRRHLAKEDIKPSILNKYLPDNIESTGFIQLENRLKDFLANEKGIAKLKKYAAIVDANINILCNLLNNKQSVLLADYQIVVQKIRQLEPQFLTAKNDTQKLSSEFLLKAQAKQHNIESRIRAHRNTALSQMQEFIAATETDALTDSYVNDTLEKIISEATENLKADLTKIQNHELSALKQEYYQKLTRIWKNMDRECRDALESSKGKNFSLEKLKSKSKLTVAASIFDTPSQGEKETIATFLVGGGIGLAFIGAPLLPIVAAGAFIAHCLGLFSNKKAKLESNASEVIKKFFNNIQKTIKDNFKKYIDNETAVMNKLFNDKLTEMESQLNLALQEKQKSQEHVDKQLAEISQYDRKLAELRKLNQKILEGVLQ